MNYFKKEVDLGSGQVKVIVYKVSDEKTVMYRDGKEFDMSDKLPKVVFGWDADYDEISKAEAEAIIAGRK